MPSTAADKDPQVILTCMCCHTQLYIPGALGMILSGVLLRNVGGGLAIAGLKASWSKQIRGAALAIIFLRSGLEIDLDVSPCTSLPASCVAC